MIHAAHAPPPSGLIARAPPRHGDPLSPTQPKALTQTQTTTSTTPKASLPIVMLRSRSSGAVGRAMSINLGAKQPG